MGDIVSDFLQALQKLLDAVKHGVKIGRQGIEFIIALGDRHALGKIARHDLGRGLLDCIDTPQHPAGRNAAGNKRKQHNSDDANHEALEDDG